MDQKLQSLLAKLEKAKFTGTLELRFERGEVASAELHHCIQTTEFTNELPVVEPETDFTLKP